MHKIKISLRTDAQRWTCTVSANGYTRRGGSLVLHHARNGASNGSSDEVGLWTDCKELVLSFKSIFEEMWRNAPDITSKLTTSKAARLSEARLIDDEEEARQKYAGKHCGQQTKKSCLSRPREVSKELSLDNRMLGGAIQKGVTIRIMAPIIDENQDAAKQLAQQTQVRHIEIGDLGTTIIDGKHIFQFKDLPIDQEMSQPMRLGKAYYSHYF